MAEKLFSVNTTSYINMRDMPSIKGKPVAKLYPKSLICWNECCTLERENKIWAYVTLDYNGVGGWVALVWPTWDEQFTLVTSFQRWSKPLAGAYSVSQNYTFNGETGHKGVDLACKVGVPVIAATEGEIAWLIHCTKCTAERPNFASHGIPYFDANAIDDVAWGYGFGNFAVVRYKVDVGYAYVIYAHLSRIDAVIGQRVQEGTVLGLVGNTGNSTGAHLHVEVRTSLTKTLASTFSLPVKNPRLFFNL